MITDAGIGPKGQLRNMIFYVLHMILYVSHMILYGFHMVFMIHMELI